jgi:hypothetical protein
MLFFGKTFNQNEFFFSKNPALIFKDRYANLCSAVNKFSVIATVKRFLKNSNPLTNFRRMNFLPFLVRPLFLGNLAIKIVLFLFVTSRVLQIEITNLVFVLNKCNYIHSSIFVKKCPFLNELESNELSSLPP